MLPFGESIRETRGARVALPAANMARTMNNWAAVLLATVLLCWVHPSDADFLADYFNEKVFGSDPGPCPGPTINDDVCTGDVTNLPDDVKKIEVCLLGDDTFCDTIGNMVREGNFTLWQLQCSHVSINDMTMSHTTSSDNTLVTASVDLQNLKLACTGQLRVELLKLVIDDTITIITTFEGPFEFYQDASADGVTVELDIKFEAESGTTLLTELPNLIEIPYDDCSVEPDLNLTLSAGEDGFEYLKVCLWSESWLGDLLCTTGLKAFTNNVIGADNTLALLVYIAEGMLSNIICQILEESAVLDNGDPGIINNIWATIKDQIDTWGTSVGQDVATCDTEAYLLSTSEYTMITQTEIDNSINFNTSTIVESVSVALNGWLGAPSSQTKYEGRPVINELIDLLTDPDGTLAIDLVALDAVLQVDDIPLNITNITAALQAFTLQGVDTLSTFEILDVGTSLPLSERYHYSFNNSLVIDSITLEIETYLLLERGDWVTALCNLPAPGTCSSDSSDFVFNFTVTVSNITFDASLLTLVNPDEVIDLQVGQIFDIDYSGEAFGAFSVLLECLAPAFYAINITNIETSIGSIADPELVNFDGTGLSTFISNSVSLGTDVVKGALRTKFPGIANGPMRELFNEVLLENVTLAGRAGTQACPAWEGPSGDGPTEIDFSGSLFAPVYALVNEGVGGNPITDNDVNLNKLLETLLEYNEDTYPSFPFESTGLPEGSWALKSEYNSNGILESFDDSSDYIQFYDFTVGNLNSIYKLLLNSTDDGLNIGFGLGGALLASDGSGLEAIRPLNLSIAFKAEVPSLGIHEVATFVLSIEELDIDFVLSKLTIDFDLIYALYFSELSNIPCLLAAIKDLQFISAGDQASLGSLSFTVYRNESNSDPATNKVSTALASLSTEQPGTRAAALITTIFDILVDKVLDVVEEIPESYENLTATTCTNATTVLDEVTDLLDLGLPNITETIAECTASIGNISSIEETEQTVYKGGDLPDLLNLKESLIVSTIESLINMLQGDTLQAVFTALGNSSGNALSDLFVLDDPSDPENGNVTFVFPLSSLNLDLNYTNEDPGFIFNAGTLRIKSVNRLLKSFTLLDPIGTMTTRNTIQFSEDNPLDISVDSTLQLDGEAAGEAAGTTITENITLSMQITDMKLVVDLVTALNYEKILNLTLSQLFSVDEEQTFSLAEFALDCWLSTYYEDGFFIRQIDLTMGTLSGVEVTSTQEILSAGMEEMIDAIVYLASYFYFDAIPNMVQNCAVPYINEVMQDSLTIASCPDSSDIDPPNLSGNNTILRLDTSVGLNQFLEIWFTDVVGEDYASLNTVLEAAADSITWFNDQASSSNGDNSYNVTIPLVYNGVSYGEIYFRIADLTIDNLGTFTDLRPLVPFGSDGEPLYEVVNYLNLSSVSDRRQLLTSEQQPYTTQTNIDIVGPLTISAKITLNAYDLFVDYPNMVNEMDISISISDLVTGLRLLLQVDIIKLLEVQFVSFSSIEQIPCLLVPVEKLVPLDFNLSTSNVQLSVSCAGTCDFPSINYLEDGGTFTNENGDEISALIDEFVNYVNNFMTTKGAQELINVAIAQAETDCAAIYDIVEKLTTFDETSKQDAASMFAYIFLGACGVAGIATLAMVPLHRRRQKRAIEAKLAGTHPSDRDTYFASEMALTELRQKSIFQHPITPTIARFMIPFVQVMNVAGLVIAIGFSDAANIIATMTIFGAETQSVALVPFTLFSTINDTWNSGAWPLAVLIAVASCMWPITKNLVLLFLWFAPTTIVKAERRRFILEVLDMLGKWSFLDVFVIVITLAALSTYVVGAYYANLSFLDDDIFITDVNVTPESGLTLLAFVAALSLLVNHLVMFYHDKVAESNQRSEDRANGYDDIARMIPKRVNRKISIMNYEFTGLTRSGATRVVHPVAAKCIVGMLVLSLVLIVVGIIVPLITFELRGLIGILLEEISANSTRLDGQQLNVKTYSVISMGQKLSTSPTSTPFEVLSLFFFKVMYAIAVYVGPIILVLIMGALFVFPVNMNTGKSLFFWTKIASYWAGLEIWMVAMILTILEISIVSQFITDFITDDVCSQIKGAIEVLVTDADLDAYCFNTVGYFEPTAVILFAGLILQLVTFYVVTVIAAAVMADRYYDAYKGLRSDAKPRKMVRLNRWILSKCTKLQTDEARVGNSASDRSSDSSLLGPFADYENQDDEELVNQENLWCCAPCNRWCENEKGQRQAEARIEAWQSRVAVASEANRRESPNPSYLRPPGARANSVASIEV